MLERAKSTADDSTERVSAPKTPLTASVFPDDVVAVIYRPARSVMTSGKAVAFSEDAAAMGVHLAVGIAVAVLAAARLWFVHRNPPRVTA